MSCHVELSSGLDGSDRVGDIDINPSLMGPISRGLDRINPWGSEMDHQPLGRSYLVVMPSYDMLCHVKLSSGLDGSDWVGDIDINPSSMGPIFGVWIGPILGVPKWTISYWAAANW